MPLQKGGGGGGRPAKSWTIVWEGSTWESGVLEGKKNLRRPHGEGHRRLNQAPKKTHPIKRGPERLAGRGDTPWALTASTEKNISGKRTPGGRKREIKGTPGKFIKKVFRAVGKG